MNRILIRNTTVLPMTAQTHDEVKYFRGHVGVEENRIAFVTDNDQQANHWASQPDVNVIDGTDKLTMPGLVNAHTHASMTLMRGYADDLPLMEWLNQMIWPFEAQMSGEDVYWGARMGIAEMLLSGTTTFLDMYTHERDVCRAVCETGIRATLSRVVFDFNADHFFSRIKHDIENHQSCDRITTVLGPHAPYTCSPDTMRKITALALQYDMGIHTHVSETLDEVKQMRERYGKTSVEYLDELGVLDHRLMAAHGIYLSERDRERLLQQGASVLHNPQSNMKLASGIAPVGDYLKMGLNVALGTDGTSSNNNLCMFDEMRSAAFLQKLGTMNSCTLPAYEVLQMATVNGAKALGMENRIGVLHPGALADIILVDMENPRFYPRFDLCAHLVYAAQGSDVDTVIVDGRILVRNKKLTLIDLPETCHEVETRAKAIVSKVKQM